MSTRFVLILTSLLTTLSLTPVPAVWAQVMCGDIIMTSTTLDADLGPCATNPALTVEGTTLDLNGFTVSCSSGDGIHLTLQGAKLSNGVVKGCLDGVVLKGTGRHRVERVLATENVDGFHVDAGSDKNKLDQNAATDNADDGFQLAGAQSTVTDNTATTNSFGFFLPFGSSSQHTLRGNTAARNTVDGFQADGTRHKFIKNVAQQNVDQGFDLRGSDLRVTQNQAFGNGDRGIKQTGADSKLLKNTALGNTGFDLSDSDVDCDNNTWKNNIFGLANQACIE